MSAAPTVAYSLQVANRPDGGYDVHLPHPKPYHVDENGLVVRHETDEGHRVIAVIAEPITWDTPSPMTVWRDIAEDPALAVGRFLVFVDRQGRISSCLTPVTAVRLADGTEVRA